MRRGRGAQFREFLAQDRDNIAALLRSGVRPSAIAARFKCCWRVAQRIAREEGIQLSRLCGAPRRVDWEGLRVLAAEHCIHDASRLVGCDRTSAIYIARKAGFAFQLCKGNHPRQPRVEKVEPIDRTERMLQLAAIARRRP